MSSIPPLDLENLLRGDDENLQQCEERFNEVILASFTRLLRSFFPLGEAAPSDTLEVLFLRLKKHKEETGDEKCIRDLLENLPNFLPEDNREADLSGEHALEDNREADLSGEHALDVSVTQDYTKAVEKARRRIRGIIAQDRLAPTFLRLAWNSAATYHKDSKTGGPFGTIRFEGELSDKANLGLSCAVDSLEGVKKECPLLSYADIHQLAGVVAVESSGGPYIRFNPGRKDKEHSAPRERLPSPENDAEELRGWCEDDLGFTDEDIVAVMGAHTVGQCTRENSGYSGCWTKNPFQFDNSYFIQLLEEEEEGLVRLGVDKALVEDPVFNRLVHNYAQDEEAFFNNYARAHLKFSELGFA